LFKSCSAPVISSIFNQSSIRFEHSEKNICSAQFSGADWLRLKISAMPVTKTQFPSFGPPLTTQCDT